MSLLLDALKKSGKEPKGGQNTNALSEMSLEEIPHAPSAESTPVSEKNTATAAPELPKATPARPPIATPRSTGENLFAAKKAPVKKFKYNLGLVPTALIIASILATAGGIYVWYEIQPPKAAQYRAPTAVAAAPQAAAPARPIAITPQPIPMLAEAPTPVQKTETQAKITQATSTPEKRIRTQASRTTPVYEESDRSIQIQRKTDHDDVYSKVMAGYQAYQNGDLNTAKQRYHEALIKDGKSRDALLGLAAIAQQQGQDDLAIYHYRQVLTLNPRDPVASAAMSGFSTGDAISKEAQLKQGLAQSPQSAALHFALGNVYTEQSKWGDAQQAYFNAFKIDPSSAKFAFGLATSLDHLGQSKLAAQYYRQALQLDSKGNGGFDHTQTEQRLNQLLAR